MDNHVERLVEMTHDILAQLQYCSYEEMDAFVAKRQILIDQLEQLTKEKPFSAMEKVHLQELLVADSAIIDRMQQLKTEAANWLQHRGLAKAQRNAYESGYTPNSILMDRKK
jgi:hypothetical protein